jgi:hypothetical protein
MMELPIYSLNYQQYEDSNCPSKTVAFNDVTSKRTSASRLTIIVSQILPDPERTS